jgi:hypothetical protein
VDLAAKDGSNANSPSFDRVKALQARAKEDAVRARAALPTSGRLADDPRIINARKLLNDAANAL